MSELSPTVFKLCAPGKKCCYHAHTAITVTSENAQLSGNKPPSEPFDSEFCITTCAKGERKAVFTSFSLPAGAKDGSVAEHWQRVKGTTVHYTLASGGELDSMACDESDKEACKVATMILKSALRETHVKVKVAAGGATQLVDMPTSLLRGSDGIGRFTRAHSQRIDEAGMIHLIATTSYDKTTIKSLEPQPETEHEHHTDKEQASFTAKYDIETSIVATAERAVVSIQTVDKSKLWSSELGSTSEAPAELAMALLEKTSGGDGDGDGDVPTEEEPSAGATEFDLDFSLKMLSSESADDETCDVSPASLIEVSQHIHLGKPSETTRLDHAKVRKAMRDGDFVAVDAALKHAPRAVRALDSDVSAWRAEGALSREAYAKYLSALALADGEQAEALYARKIQDPALQAAEAEAIDTAMTSLLVRPRVPRALYSALRSVAMSSAVPDLRDTAVLVLSGLLNRHAHLEQSAELPAWIRSMFDEVVGAVREEGIFRPEVCVAALGNTRWPSTEPMLAKFLAHDDLFTVHGAVDGLRHHRVLSAATERALVAMLARHDWAHNATAASQIPAKSIGLLQHSLNLKGDDCEGSACFDKMAAAQTASDCTGSDCFPPDKSYKMRIPIFNKKFAPFTKSDYHSANAYTGVSMSLSTGGDFSVSAGAALEAVFFKFKFQYTHGNAVTDLTFEAKRAADGTYSRGLYWSIVGVKIKAWGPDASGWFPDATNKLSLNLDNDLDHLNSKCTEHSVCKGRFDFAQAEFGVTHVSSGTQTLKLGKGALILKVDKTQTVFKGTYPFLIWPALTLTATVEVKIDGTIGVEPAVAWDSNEADGCSKGGVTYVAGLKPFAKLDLSLGVFLELLGGFLGRAGIEGKLTLIHVAFPVYGRYDPALGSTAPTCGSFEVETAAFSGSISAVIQSRDWTFTYQTHASIKIFSWRGVHYAKQIYRHGNDRCAWRTELKKDEEGFWKWVPVIEGAVNEVLGPAIDEEAYYGTTPMPAPPATPREWKSTYVPPASAQ